MKRIHNLLACVLSLATALAVQARPLEEIKKEGKMVVATEGQFAPFNYFQGSKLVGFEIDLTDLIAKKMGVTIEWKALGFDALLTGLRQDRWDLVVASHGITEERAKSVSFADPHYCSGGVVVSVDPAIRTPADLAGKAVSVSTGSTYFENVKKLGTVKDIRNFPSEGDARSALVSRRVDAWVTDRLAAKQSIAANPGAGMKMGEFVFVERDAAAAAKGNTTLIQAYNKALSELLADGTYATISQKYFGEDIRCK